MLDLAQWFVTTHGPRSTSSGSHSKKEHPLSCVRLDGSLRREERERVLKQFRSSNGPPILFASLKTCGVGINLTCASCVVMLDLWWNPAVEAQALDRVHRLGQSQAVRVWRLTVTGTVEEKLLAMQVLVSKCSYQVRTPTKRKSVAFSLDSSLNLALYLFPFFHLISRVTPLLPSFISLCVCGTRIASATSLMRR